jgi:hypothetical protein
MPGRSHRESKYNHYLPAPDTDCPTSINSRRRGVSNMLPDVKEISGGTKAHIPREDCDSQFTVSERDLWNCWKWNVSVLRWNEIEPLLENVRLPLATFCSVEGSLFMHEVFELFYEMGLGLVFSFARVPCLCYRMHQINRSYFRAQFIV